jgi:hypothetical protein
MLKVEKKQILKNIESSDLRNHDLPRGGARRPSIARTVVPLRGIGVPLEHRTDIPAPHDRSDRTPFGFMSRKRRATVSPEARLAEPADLPQILLFLIPSGTNCLAKEFQAQLLRHLPPSEIFR